MGQKESNEAFLTAVDQSFLSVEEKETLRRSAASGVTKALWNRFNDQLIAAIVNSRGEQRQYVQTLDAEIDRYTVEYEKEKTVLDRHFREELAQTASGPAKQKKWGRYEQQIRALQARFVKEVRDTSTSVLHDVILATVPIDNGER